MVYKTSVEALGSLVAGHQLQIQDWRAVHGQRFDTREHLSSTDNEVVLWRKLVATSARGIEHPGESEASTETLSERFARERLDELGIDGEVK